MQGFKEKKLLYTIRKEKDPAAFAELYDAYVQKVYRFVFFKLSNKEEAEDLVSELFLKAWYYLADDHNKEVRSFSGFIYHMARNMIVDFYRERVRKHEVLDEQLELQIPTSPQLIDTIGDRLEAEAILQHVKSLKQEYQDVVILKYVEELRTKEIATILGKSTTNVRVTLHRAMKLLRGMVDPASSASKGNE